MKKSICLSLILSMLLFNVACGSKNEILQESLNLTETMSTEQMDSASLSSTGPRVDFDDDDHDDDDHDMEDRLESKHAEYAARYTLEAGKVYRLKVGHTHKRTLTFSFEPNTEPFGITQVHEAFRSAVQRSEHMVEDGDSLDIRETEAYFLKLKHQKTAFTFKVEKTGVYWFITSQEIDDDLFFELYDEDNQELLIEKRLYDDHD